MRKKIFTILLALAASVGMSWATSDPANPIAVENGTKDGFSYTLYDNGLLEISGSGAMPNHAFVEEDFSADVKNIRFAKDCEVYSLGDMWFRCYDSKYSQLETVEINSVVPISFLGEGIFYKQESAVTITITAPGIVNVESEIVGNYYSPVNMIFNVPATTVFEKNWFLRNQSYYAITIPTGATGHVPASLAFTDPDKQSQYDDAVEMGNEEWFWDMFGDGLKEGVDYNKVEESTFVITAENASQIFGPATVYFQDPEPQPQPAQQVITWSAQSCHDVEAYYNMGQIITANNSKDGITVTYSGSDVNDLDGMRIGGIFLTGGTNSKMTFTSTVGNISKIEVYYYTNVLEDVPVGWTHEVSYDKFVWEGTPATSVDMMKGADRVGFYIKYIDFTIVGAAEPEPEPQPAGNLKLIEFQVPASWENDNTPISIADFPGFVATTYEIASALPVTSEPSLVIFDFPGDDEVSVYTKLGGQVSDPSTGTFFRENFFDQQTQIHYYYPVLAGDEPDPQPADVEIIPNVDPENPTVYYSTFYDSEVKYLLPENVEAYVATLNGANLLLSKIADAGQTIPANNAVILKSTVTPFTLSISDAEAVPVNAINSLQGTDVSIATPANCYVLAGNDGVGFYHYTASMLNPHKAYVIYSGTPNQAPHRMPFVFEVATDVESIQSSAVSSQKVFRDGQLVIIRNGIEYNAAGQMVK